MAEIKSESAADFIPESVADFARNTQSADSRGDAGDLAAAMRRRDRAASDPLG
jgi:hypothetical protein